MPSRSDLKSFDLRNHAFRMSVIPKKRAPMCHVRRNQCRNIDTVIAARNGIANVAAAFFFCVFVYSPHTPYSDNDEFETVYKACPGKISCRIFL